MPVFCLKIDSNPDNVGSLLQYEIKQQPITLKMIHYDFYDPITNLPLRDPYTRSLKIKVPFLTSHQFVSNSVSFEDGLDIPIERGDSNKTSGIITGLDFTFEPDQTITFNNISGNIFHNVNNKVIRYNGYFTDPTDPSTLANVGVQVSLYFEYDILRFDN